MRFFSIISSGWLDDAIRRLPAEALVTLFGGMLGTVVIAATASGKPFDACAFILDSAQALLHADQVGAAVILLFALPIVIGMAGLAYLALTASSGKLSVRSRQVIGIAIHAIGILALGWLAWRLAEAIIPRSAETVIGCAVAGLWLVGIGDNIRRRFLMSASAPDFARRWWRRS